MKNVRVKQTENEKFASRVIDSVGMNMSEDSIDNLIKDQKIRKFNSELDTLNEQLQKSKEDIENNQKDVAYDITKAEIKPMFSRVLIKQYNTNPFQKMEERNGIVIATGGYRPNVELNPLTGKYEQKDEFIKTGCVIEVGPDTKYLKEGDTVFYRKDTTVPVPFFMETFVCLDEKQIIAVVNEGLEERFKNIK